MPPDPYAQFAKPQADPYAATLKPKPREYSTWEMIDNIVRQAASGGALGFADEAAAAADAATRPVLGRGSDAGSFSERYGKNLKANRDQDKEFSKAYPWLSTGANVVGTLGSAVAAAPFLPAWVLGGGGASLLGNIVRGVGSGAVLGGIGGAGEAEGGPWNRVMGAGTGAAIGGITGGVLPPVIAAGSALARPLGQHVAAPVLDKLAGVANYFTPKVQPKSLSAAAPDGGPGVAAAGVMSDITEALRSGAGSMRDVREREGMMRTAQAMMRSGRTPAEVRQYLDEAGPNAMLVNALGLNAQDLLRTAYSMPGPQKEMIRRAVDLQEGRVPSMMTRAFQGDTPPPAAYDARRFLEGAREGAPYGVTPPRGQGYIATEGDRLYAPLRADSSMTITPQMQTVMDTSPVVREAYENVLANAAHNGETLTPFDVLHRVKRQLNMDSAKANAPGPGRAPDATGAAGAADRWERAFYQSYGPVQAADQGYAQLKALPDWLTRGREFLSAGTSEKGDAASAIALATEFPYANAIEQQLFRVGATDTVADKALQSAAATRRLAQNVNTSEPFQRVLGTTFPDQAPDIIAKSRVIRDFGEAKNRITGGSNTFDKLAAGADQGIPNILPGGGSQAGHVTRAIDFVGDKYRELVLNNEAVRDTYTRMLIETNPAIQAQYLQQLDTLVNALRGGAPIRTTAAVSGAPITQEVMVELPTLVRD